jgi:cation-transporting ATPase 13A3/4/5
VPIAKFKLNDESKIRESAHWLFEGSLVETKRDGTLAQAVHVGFSSRRGRIIRKILTKQAKQPEFFKKLIHFLIVVLIVSVVIFVATLNPLLELDIEPIMVVFRFCDFITYSFPAPFPIFFNLAYSFCLVRLKRDDIIGTEC